MSQTYSYVSSLDSQARYADGQEVWLQFSTGVINELSSKFSDIRSKKSTLHFGDILTQLGQKRREIAQQLKHGEDDRRLHYGELRGEHFLSYEVFFENKSDSVWARMAPQVFATVDEMATKIGTHGDKEEDGGILYMSEDESWGGVKSGDETDIHISAPESSQEHYSKSLANIQLFDQTETEPRAIRITYANVNRYNQRGDFAIATEYLLSMLETTDGDIESFLDHAGKFCHLMANILPFKLGTAGITEWIIRAAAHSKGINLGPFNLDEGLSWDFKALLTPNRDVYAKWFVQNAFIKPELQNSSEPFSFKHSTAPRLG